MAEGPVQEFQIVIGDLELYNMCIQFEIPEAYKALQENGITFELIQELEEDDINQLPLSLRLKIIFRREWRKWRLTLPRPEPTQTESTLPVSWEAGLCISKLLETDKGKVIKAFFDTNGWLDELTRSALIDLILEEAASRKFRLKVETLVSISEDIAKVFPSESPTTYVVRKGSGRVSYGGKLYNRYHNKKRPPAKKSKKDDPSSSPTEIVDESDAETHDGADLDMDEDVKVSLKSGDISFLTEDVLHKWQRTFLLRRNDSNTKNVTEVLKEWPLFGNKQFGYTLIDDDFKALFPMAHALDEQWSVFFEKIQDFLKDNVKDKHMKEQYHQLSSLPNEGNIFM